MTSGDERAVYIRAQYYDEGRSAIELGAELGLSRSQIHRIVAAGPPANDEDDNDNDDGEDVIEPVPVFVEPFTYCGVERETVQYRGEDPRMQEGERWMDANGRSCSVLDIYRYWAHRAGDHGDYETGERVRADMARQRAEWR